MILMEIRPLPEEQFRGYCIHAVYETTEVYHVHLLERGFFLKLEKLEKPVMKSWKDTLFGDWLEAPVALGAFQEERLLGVVEGSPERWHNLFRISNLFVEPSERRRGIGKALLGAMVDLAKRETACRGVILETQTCNAPAIALYESLGFRLCRIDLTEYSNHDVENQEVRIDLMLPM